MDDEPDSAEFGPPVADVFIPNVGPVFDPAPHREWTRRFLAIGVFLLLVATVGFILVPIILGVRTWNQMQGVAASVLPAVLSISGTVLAFYFATEEKK